MGKSASPFSDRCTVQIDTLKIGILSSFIAWVVMHRSLNTVKDIFNVFIKKKCGLKIESVRNWRQTLNGMIDCVSFFC